MLYLFDMVVLFDVGVELRFVVGNIIVIVINVWLFGNVLLMLRF